MLKKGILNPHINSLLSRVRHNNLLVIADRGFTNFPGVETVLQVFNAIKPNFDICQLMMAEEFLLENTKEVQDLYKNAFGNIPISYEPSADMKKRVPKAIGIIRTAETIQYSNMLLFSGRVDEE